MRGLIAPAVAAALCAGCAASGGDRPFVPADRAAATQTAPATSAGSATGTRPAPSGSSSAQVPASSARVETLSVGRAVKVLMEWPAGLDPEETEMIEGYRDYYVNAWKAVATRGRDQSYLSSIEFEAIAMAEAWVSQFVDHRQSVRGTARLYLPDVTAVAGRGGKITICVEEAGLRLTDVTTGRAVADQPYWTKPPRSTFLQGAELHRDDDGVWRVRSLLRAELPHDRAKGCKR
jgi:hypothetical protein